MSEELEYQYDVFISYPHKSPARDWVRVHFHPRFAEWLSESVPPEYNPKVFIDTSEVDVGTSWPERLQKALLRSKFLVPILCPGYFRSAWCSAEWATMRQREDILRLRTVDRPEGLIFPVLFHDGEHLLPDAQRIQHTDMRKWNIPTLSFTDTPGYPEFVRAVQAFAGTVATQLPQAPSWQSDWPVQIPDTILSPPMTLPRFS